MAHGRTQDGRTSNRGFASMDEERQRQIASMGGKAVPDAKRSFSQNRRLAAEAGRKGGQSVPGPNAAFRRIASWPRRRVARAARACLTRSAASRRTPSSRLKRAQRRPGEPQLECQRALPGLGNQARDALADQRPELATGLVPVASFCALQRLPVPAQKFQSRGLAPGT